MGGAFARLLVARGLSLVGDGVARTAVVLLVAGRGHGGLAVGLLLLCETLPRVLGPLAGALSDRLRTRRVLVGTDLAQAAIYAAIALLHPALGVLCALVAAAAGMTMLFGTASSAGLVRVVASEGLPAANALLGSVTNGAVVGGPLLGGVLVGLGGTDAAFAVQIATFLSSAALLGSLAALDGTPEPSGAGVVADARAGIAFVLADRVLRTVVLALAVGVLFAGMDNVALVFLVSDELGAGPVAYGALTAAWGGGMLAGSLALTGRLGGAPAGTVLVVASATMGTGLVLTGVAPLVGLALVAQAVGGVGNGLNNVAYQTLVQLRVPEALLGRAFGTVLSGVFLAGGLAAAVGGALVELTSARAVLVLAGAGMLAVTLATAPVLAGVRGDERVRP